MATNQPAKSSMQAKEDGDEEQLQQALKQLKLLHIKCRELRTAIPRILEQATCRSSPENFATVVLNTTTELRDFKTLYTNEESKRVLEQARKSREAQPKNIKPWRASDHPDWLDMA
ncbi:uncharacterized protein BCR38DRAFT_423640 [Pseudomassariella vexata]|uniref:Uncharacterized protein n=1 Tax=Pseudomassariella vexata TaxID=1141098 RepID=A0A1Y2EBC9_9PEZI|nr:uncharacterized protein BCR38DRAFT_423640 [Pseudomassariella vexata]ORY68566.1 hypothetical protein BCR38DRAFT_423640 [Pseudomassariella vexata]